MWGMMLSVGGSPGYPWGGAQTLLREITPRADGRLGVAPAAEVEALRGKHWHFQDVAVEGPGTPLPESVAGECLELGLRIDPANAAEIGVDVRCTPGGNACVPIRYNKAEGIFSMGERKASFALLPDERTLDLRIFLDRRIIEVYINGRETMTGQTSLGGDALGIRLFSDGGAAKAKRLDIWEMGTIWENDV